MLSSFNSTIIFSIEGVVLHAEADVKMSEPGFALIKLTVY